MIYIHVPFCHRKCTYCAFYSVVAPAARQAYVDALCRELAMRSHEMEHPIGTVYFGGGTPTMLTPAQLGQIIGTLQSHYDLSALGETTVEANPEDLTPDYLAALRALGFFNRISIGVQSFSDDDLRLLNRRHNASQAIEAVCNAHAAGFENICIDLIYGIPRQPAGQWLANLEQAARLPVVHLSAYSLTVEPGTILQKQTDSGRLSMPADDETRARYDALTRWAQGNGFVQYEISNFCRPGFKSRHNSRYWDRTPYLGVGAAAHSFDGLRRRWNVADADRYVASVSSGHIAHQEEELTLKDACNEYVMTSLRTTSGIDKHLLPIPFRARIAREIRRFVENGLLTETPTHYVPTPQGLLHADGIAAELFL